MRETIVCIGQSGKKAYRFPETEVSITSYEELCYYLKNHMICYLYSLPEDDLLIYIRDELGLDKLYRQLVKLRSPEKDQMKFFATLFREGNYYNEEEIRQILDYYRSLKNEAREVQYKKLGDLMLRYGKATMAIRYYEEGLKCLAGSEGREVGSLYHNKGIANARLFRFEDAKIDFLKAYQNNNDENSLFYYYGILVFCDGDMGKAAEEIKSFRVSDLTRESFEERFASLIEEQQYTEEAAKYRKLVYMNINRRGDEAEGSYHTLLDQLKNCFRRQLDDDEKWVVTNVPVGYSIDKK